MMPTKDKALQRKLSREHYERNKEAIKARAVEFTIQARLRNREYVDAVKSVPCTDCKIQYPPYVMQFDHITNDKLCNVGAMVQNARPLQVIQREIDKCEIVCANCHAQRTHERRK